MDVLGRTNSPGIWEWDVVAVSRQKHLQVIVSKFKVNDNTLFVMLQ